jgi:hypothetical protein
MTFKIVAHAEGQPGNDSEKDAQFESFVKSFTMPFVPFIGTEVKLDPISGFLAVTHVMWDPETPELVHVYFKKPDSLPEFAAMLGAGWQLEVSRDFAYPTTQYVRGVVVGNGSTTDDILGRLVQLRETDKVVFVSVAPHDVRARNDWQKIQDHVRNRSIGNNRFDVRIVSKEELSAVNDQIALMPFSEQELK